LANGGKARGKKNHDAMDGGEKKKGNTHLWSCRTVPTWDGPALPIGKPERVTFGKIQRSGLCQGKAGKLQLESEHRPEGG